jgi:hypothetical protein
MFYVVLVSLLASWLIVILFIPVGALVLRGGLLHWRYIRENAVMNRLFMRRIKWAVLSLLGGGGCLLTQYVSASALQAVISACLR